MFYSKNKIQLSPRLKLGVGRAYSQNHIFKFAAIFCLTLALGLAVHAIWIVFTPKKSDLANENQAQVLGATDTKNSNELSEIQFEEYKIQKGDTLFNLSQKF